MTFGRAETVEETSRAFVARHFGSEGRAWLGGLRAFRQESDVGVVGQESMFWVVTRSLQCFY